METRGRSEDIYEAVGGGLAAYLSYNIMIDDSHPSLSILLNPITITPSL